ncbi:MAG TPA: hypothetical protein GX507_02535 [Clostridia bacterium]|nr:hypothetical protein [Clostridia bacterium]
MIEINPEVLRKRIQDMESKEYGKLSPLEKAMLEGWKRVLQGLQDGTVVPSEPVLPAQEDY